MTTHMQWATAVLAAVLVALLTLPCVHADGWQAKVRKAEPNRIGSLVIGGASVEFSGDTVALEAMFKQLHWKTLRGGG